MDEGTRIIDKFDPTKQCKGTDSFSTLKVGDPIEEIETGRQGTLIDIAIKPNGVNSPELVALLYVKFEGRVLVATSNKFKTVDDAIYSLEYPTSKMFHVAEEWEEKEKNTRESSSSDG